MSHREPKTVSNAKVTIPIIQIYQPHTYIYIYTSYVCSPPQNLLLKLFIGICQEIYVLFFPNICFQLPSCICMFQTLLHVDLMGKDPLLKLFCDELEEVFLFINTNIYIYVLPTDLYCNDGLAVEPCAFSHERPFPVKWA